MEPEALAAPFVTVGDRGGFSRVLLADVVGVREAPLLRVVVKLQSDEYPFLPEGTGVTNPDVEAAWAREADLLARCAPAAVGIPPPVEVLDRRPGEPAVLPPTLYCKRRRAFFTAPCPTCGAPLTDVRDDRLLESLALPLRDRPLVRFLPCRVCGPARLWTLFREPDMAPSAPVGDAQDLFRPFAPLAHPAGAGLLSPGAGA